MGVGTIARGIALGIAAMALNVAIAFGWVILYSVAVDPGHDGAFYQAYARAVAPICAIIAGIPLLFLAGWLSARRATAAAAWLPAAAYIILDAALLAFGGVWPPMWLLALSWLTKLAAAWGGGAYARRRAG